ncbi:hypothetical protein K7432_015183 [Basidiobolus ranarum]|uniref:Uncharacterized protein n=1 Tax=Basidiobolus ranarum TaxID=34480 RepID=A0ABR2VNL2_9FUNG
MDSSLFIVVSILLTILHVLVEIRDVSRWEQTSRRLVALITPKQPIANIIDGRHPRAPKYMKLGYHCGIGF